MMHRPMLKEPRVPNMIAEGVGAVLVTKMILAVNRQALLEEKEEDEEVVLGEIWNMLSSKLTATPETMSMSLYQEEVGHTILEEVAQMTRGETAVMMEEEEVYTMMISIEMDFPVEMS